MCKCACCLLCLLCLPSVVQDCPQAIILMSLSVQKTIVAKVDNCCSALIEGAGRIMRPSPKGLWDLKAKEHRLGRLGEGLHTHISPIGASSVMLCIDLPIWLF